MVSPLAILWLSAQTATVVPAAPEPVATPRATRTATGRQPPRPPRIDGVYLGAQAFGVVAIADVSKLDTPGALGGWGAQARVGQMLLPWFGLGIAMGGALGWRGGTTGRQRLGMGQLLIDATFVPVSRIPWSLALGAGFGGGAVREAGIPGRSGFGGAVLSASTRYEFFPGAARRRPTTAGGFGIGPTLGWLGAPPTQRGGVMAHLFVVGLTGTFYFGE